MDIKKVNRGINNRQRLDPTCDGRQKGESQIREYDKNMNGRQMYLG